LPYKTTKRGFAKTDFSEIWSTCTRSFFPQTIGVCMPQEFSKQAQNQDAFRARGPNSLKRGCRHLSNSPRSLSVVVPLNIPQVHVDILFAAPTSGSITRGHRHSLAFQAPVADETLAGLHDNPKHRARSQMHRCNSNGTGEPARQIVNILGLSSYMYSLCYEISRKIVFFPLRLPSGQFEQASESSMAFLGRW